MIPIGVGASIILQYCSRVDGEIHLVFSYSHQRSLSRFSIHEWLGGVTGGGGAITLCLYKDIEFGGIEQSPNEKEGEEEEEDAGICFRGEE